MSTETAETPKAASGYPDASRYIDAPMDADVQRDPYPALRRLAAIGPVLKGEGGKVGGVQLPDYLMYGQSGRDIYYAFSYNAVRQLAMDAKNFSNELAYDATYRRTFGETLMAVDAPRHTQLKKLVLPAFSHRVVNEDLIKVAGPVIRETLDRVAGKGQGELVAEFCLIFPFIVIARIFGVPDHLAQQAEDLVVAATTMHDNPERALAALDQMNALYLEVVEAHRQGGLDDLTTALMNSEVDGVRLNDDEVIGFIKQIVTAGLDTTVRATATFLYLMLEYPEQFADLKANPDLLVNAIYEAMRFESAGGVIPRVALRDTEIEGVRIPAGAGVYGIIHSANRDPSRWENPDRFDIRRSRQQFMTLGAGPHSCLGANLTIVEQSIALTGALDRLKNLRKDPERWDDAHIHGFQLRSPTKLPVLWDV